MPDIRIQLTGTVGVFGCPDADPGPPVGGQALLVLGILVLERHAAIAREQLASLVWPDGLPRTWEPSLRALVSKVRALFGAVGITDPRIVSAAFGCYQLRLPPGVDVDVEAAARTLAAAREAEQTGDHDAAARLAGQASQVLRRPLLSGVTSGWVEVRRAELRGDLLRALTLQAAATIATGRPREAVPPAAEAAALEPFDESAARLLITAHSLAGNRAEALRVYDALRHRLADDLGVDPDAETQACYLALLRETAPAAPRAAAAPPRAPLPPALDPRGSLFVGRVTELDWVRRHWRDVLDETPVLALVSGEAGIGKTRFAAECAQVVSDSGARVLYGGCEQDLTYPFEPFARALAAYADSLPADDLTDALGSLAGELTRLLPGLADRVPGLAPAAATDLATSRSWLVDAVCQAISAAARRSPLLLVIDDLQWSGPATRQALRRLVETVHTGRIMVIGTWRGDDYHAALGDVIGRARAAWTVAELPLSGLGRDEVAELATGLQLPAAVADETYRRSDGNPLFVGQLLRHVAAGHSVDDLPGTARDSVFATVAALPPEVHTVLSAAAVVGDEVDVGLLVATTGLPADTVVDAIDAALGSTLLRADVDVPDRVRFTHHLVRSALYDELSAPRRLLLHQRVAHALERRPDAQSRVIELAEHFFAAAPLLSESDAAIRYGRLAGERAAAALDFEHAAQYYRRALDLLGDAPDLAARCDLRRACGEALTRLSHPAQRQYLLDAAADARALGDADRLARVALAFDIRTYLATRDEELVALLEEALDALPRQATATRGRLQGMLAVALMWTPAEATRRVQLVAEATETLRETADRAALAAHLMNTYFTLSSPGSARYGLDVGDELIMLGDELNLAAARWQGHMVRCDALALSGDLAASEGELALAETSVGLTREPRNEFETRCRRVCFTILTGDVREAEAQALALHEFSRSVDIGELVIAATQAGQLLAIRDMQGRAGELVGMLDMIVEQTPELPQVLGTAAFTRASAGQRERAAAALDGYLHDLREPVPGDAMWLAHIGYASRAAALLGHAAGAERVYEFLRPYSGNWVWILSSCGGPVDLHLGLCAATAGRRDVALGHLERSIAQCRRNRAPYWLAMGSAQADRLRPGEPARTAL
ncbi:MAG TPA: BTAD domain-containing putative transcriptional regulator [Jatrophihabitantaceae bacterium]|nr:BTAD domain-containing putative transcriptional regulator [Jatrophihabitantaceae bacterium]